MAHVGPHSYEYLFERDLSARVPGGFFGTLPKYVFVSSGTLGFLTWEWNNIYPGAFAEGFADYDTGEVTYEFPPQPTSVGLCSFIWKWKLTFEEDFVEVHTQLRTDDNVSPWGIIRPHPLENLNFIAGGIELNEWLEDPGPDPVFWLLQARPWAGIPT